MALADLSLPVGYLRAPARWACAGVSWGWREPHAPNMRPGCKSLRAMSAGCHAAHDMAKTSQMYAGAVNLPLPCDVVKAAVWCSLGAAAL